MPQESWTTCALLFLENVWNPRLLSILVPWDRQPWTPRQGPEGPLTSLLWALTHPQASASCFVLSWDAHGPSSHHMWTSSRLSKTPTMSGAGRSPVSSPTPHFYAIPDLSSLASFLAPHQKQLWSGGRGRQHAAQTTSDTGCGHVHRRTWVLLHFRTGLNRRQQLHRSLKCGDLY